MITMEEIQKKLSDYIKNSGKTQKELAKLLNVSQSTVSKYSKGISAPPLDTFANICIVLDLDLYDILCIENKYR